MRRFGKGSKKQTSGGFLRLIAGGIMLGMLGVWPVAMLSMSAENVVYAEEEAFVPSEIPAPEFSAEAGFYEAAFELSLTAPEETEIYYTLDGAMPVPGGITTLPYTDPIPVELCESRKGEGLPFATVVRAIAVTKEGDRSDVVTKTYFVTEHMTEWYKVPVVALTVDPEDLYSTETGIITNAEEKGREWERPAHFEYFLPEGTREIAMNAGIRINGAYSRRFEMKSFRLYARSEYDTQKSFVYDFFSDGLIPAVEKNGEGEKIEKFKRILLRGGGNESDAWETTFFRDILAQSLMAGTSLDLQSYQPAVVYVNGGFYGILNIRERMDDRYLASHYNCGEEDVVIYGFKYNKDEDGNVILPPGGQDAFSVVAEEGPEEEVSFFEEAYAFVTGNDMSDDTQYQKAREYFDIENFIDYLCLQLYCGNTDWPHNNCEAWRYTGEPSEEYGLDGKIRWLVFDTEFGFGLYGHRPEEQIIASMVADQWYEQPYRDVLTGLFRAFLKNEGFKQQFRTRFLELLDTNFAAESVLAKVAVLEEIYRPLVEEKYLKYGERHPVAQNMATVKEYAASRAGYVKECLTWALEPELHRKGAGSGWNPKMIVGIAALLVIGITVFLTVRKKKEKNE